jgi:hypothetical protein
MIKTFETFNEIDPYGEEDWNDYDDMLRPWDWNFDYFENKIFKMVNLPEKFTIDDFIEKFNKIQPELRKNIKGYSVILTKNYSHDINRLSRLLYYLVDRNILKVKHVSKSHKTIPIFKKID